MVSAPSWVRPVIIIFFLLSLIPWVIPVLRTIENEFRPVVTDFVFTHVEKTDKGLLFNVRFKKRNCDPISVNFYDSINRLVPHDFEPDSQDLRPLFSRPPGVNYAGPWLLAGEKDFDGLWMETIHHCHWWWTSRSRINLETAPVLDLDWETLEIEADGPDTGARS